MDWAPLTLLEASLLLSVVLAGSHLIIAELIHIEVIVSLGKLVDELFLRLRLEVSCLACLLLDLLIQFLDALFLLLFLQDGHSLNMGGADT